MPKRTAALASLRNDAGTFALLGAVGGKRCGECVERGFAGGKEEESTEQSEQKDVEMES